MGYKIALIKPDTNPVSGIDVEVENNEAGTQTVPAYVTHFYIEPTQGFKVSKFIDNKIKRYVGKGALAIPLRSIYRTFVFNKVFLGNLEDDAKARNRQLFLDYAEAEWPKAIGKVSPLYFYNGSTGAEWTTSYNSTTVGLFDTYKGGAYTRTTCLIEKSELSYDVYWNAYIDQLVVTEVWS